MRGLRYITVLFAAAFLFVGCTTSYYLMDSCEFDDENGTLIYNEEEDCVCPAWERVIYPDDEEIIDNPNVLPPEAFQNPQAYQSSQEEIYVPKCPNYRAKPAPNVTASGEAICPPKKRCPDDRLPPQPCAQPIPTYYSDVSQEILAQGIVLIHPYTRTQVLCYDRDCESAVNCAQDFRAKGYVLITDLPQQPAKYDFLRKGTYPTRRWRNGETVPRW